jgi:hypothetical protein
LLIDGYNCVSSRFFDDLVSVFEFFHFLVFVIVRKKCRQKPIATGLPKAVPSAASSGSLTYQ